MHDVDTWLETNFVSKNTRKLYRTALNNFHQRFGEISTEAQLEQAIKQWINQLSADYVPKTINAYVAAVISYYKDHGITLDPIAWQNIRRRLLPPAHATTFDKAGTHDEWKRILSYMTLKPRSLFLFLLSSGCRIGETLQLRISDLDLATDPPRAYIRPEYTKGGFGGRIVFFTYEARDAIEQYLELKLNLGLKKKTPHRVYIPKWHRYVYFEEHEDDRVWDINHQTASEFLYEALRRAGLDERDPRTGRRLIHIHSTRKFFRSNCGLPDALTHALMGHRGYLDRSYLRLDPDKAGEEYKNIAIPRLSIFERTTTDKLEILKTIARSLGISDDRIATTLQNTKDRGFYDISLAIGQLIKQELSKPKKEYIIAEENQVQGLLLEGYDIVKVLNDGRFLMVRT